MFGRVSSHGLILAVCLSGPIRAHGPIHELIDAVNAEIAAAPKRADLYVRRAEYHRIDGDWVAALADLDRARELEPERASIDFVRAGVYLDAGWHECAEALLNEWLETRPNDLSALEMRARSRAALGRRIEAARDYTLVIAKSPRPQALLYFERARVLSDAGQLDAALRGIDEGLAKLGFSRVLVLFAVELEVGAERWDAALARFAGVPPRFASSLPWRMKHAEVLAAAGRAQAAREAYAGVLTMITELGERQRSTPSIRETEKTVRAALAELARAER